MRDGMWLQWYMVHPMFLITISSISRYLPLHVRWFHATIHRNPTPRLGRYKCVIDFPSRRFLGQTNALAAQIKYIHWVELCLNNRAGWPNVIFDPQNTTVSYRGLQAYAFGIMKSSEILTGRPGLCRLSALRLINTVKCS